PWESIAESVRHENSAGWEPSRRCTGSRAREIGAAPSPVLAWNPRAGFPRPASSLPSSCHPRLLHCLSLTRFCPVHTLELVPSLQPLSCVCSGSEVQTVASDSKASEASHAIHSCALRDSQELAGFSTRRCVKSIY